MSLKRIIIEEVQNFTQSIADNITFEGIGDKYGEREFGIPNEPQQQDLLAQQGILGKPQAVVDVQRNGERVIDPIYKNPQSLQGFDKDVRAIALPDGTLYVMQLNKDIMHGEMGTNLKLIPGEFGSGMYQHLDKWQFLQRIGTEAAFGVGDTNKGWMERNLQNWRTGVQILRATKARNPQFDYYPVYYQTAGELELEPVDANGEDGYDYPMDEFGDPMFDEPYEQQELQFDQAPGNLGEGILKEVLDVLNEYEELIADLPDTYEPTTDQQPEFSEGVADRYAERRFNIPDPSREQDRIAQSGIKNSENGELVGVISGREPVQYRSGGGMTTKPAVPDTQIFKNPRTLRNIEADVKAITTKQGDLYIAQTDSDIYHSQIATAVNTGASGDQIHGTYDGDMNVTWHRLGRTQTFGFSVSYMEFWHDQDERPIAEEMLSAAKARNPQYEFLPDYWQDMRPQSQIRNPNTTQPQDYPNYNADIKDIRGYELGDRND